MKQPVKIVEYSTLRPGLYQLLRHCLKDSLGVVPFDNPLGAKWWIAYIGTKPVGCVCLSDIKGVARFKNDVVSKNHRGKGIYQQLSNARLQWFMQSQYQKADAFASTMSLNTFVRLGFNEQKKAFKNSTYLTLSK